MKSSPSTNKGANVRISPLSSLYQYRVYCLEFSLFIFIYLFVVIVKFELDNLRKDFNNMNRQIAQLKIVSLSFSFENLFFLNKLYVCVYIYIYIYIYCGLLDQIILFRLASTIYILFLHYLKKKTKFHCGII